MFKKKCPSCGVKNNKERVTCIECGAPFELGKVSEPYKKLDRIERLEIAKKRWSIKKIIPVIIGIVVISVIIIGNVGQFIVGEGEEVKSPEPTISPEPATSLEPAIPPQPVMPPEPATSPEPTLNLIYQDDFSSQASGWPRYSGEDRETGYEDGEYHILVNKFFWAASVWNRNVGRFTDFALEIDARLVSGPNDPLYGVIFRVQPTEAENYYRFLVSGDGYYLIGTKTKDVWTTLQRKTKSAFIKEGNSTNHLKVVCKGSQIEVYVNGHHLTTITDKSFAEGIVGMIVDTPQPDTLVAFDNLKVYSLE